MHHVRAAHARAKEIGGRGSTRSFTLTALGFWFLRCASPDRFFRFAPQARSDGQSRVVPSQLTLLIEHLKCGTHASRTLFCLPHGVPSVADPKATLIFVFRLPRFRIDHLTCKSPPIFTCQRMLFEQPTMSIYCYRSGKSTSCVWVFAHL